MRLFFEAALDIVIEEVIGWDLKRGKPREGVTGLFGVPLGFVAAVEEQGRGTLHVHIQIWVKEFSEWRESLHSTDRNEQRDAAKKIEESMDNVGRCSLFFDSNDGERSSEIVVTKAFIHECAISNPQFRRNPVVVDDQKLRYLRYKEGSYGASGMLAYCPHCTTSWTSEELLESYLINGVNVPGLTKYPDNEVRRLKSMAVEYQKNSGGDDTVKTSIIDAAYNHHSHTSTSCFGKQGTHVKASGENNRKRKATFNSQNCECRYRCPHRKKRKTVVQNASETEVQWYDWHGSSQKRFIKEVCVRRRGYDAFQNVCCHAISHSKLTCNTNVSAVMPGPLGQYNFKYNLKDTQEEDTEEYGRVKESMQKVLSRARTHELDRSEAMKRLLAGSFAHLKTNVLRASMARFLTWRKSRFIFSHDTVWCPLRDLRSALHGGGVDASVVHHGSLAFFQCVALHYLCRPSELEALSAFDFFSKFEVVRVTSQNENQLLEFYDGGTFQHPSYSCKKESFLQGVRERTVSKLVKIYQYDFPDAAEFGGSLLDDDTVVTETMERYSELVLLLFFPYRKLEDLNMFGSYTECLRDAICRGVIGEIAQSFLQNLQDTKSNSFRVTRLEDDLQRNTEPLQKQSVQETDGALFHAEDDVDEDDEVEGLRLDEFLEMLDMEGNNSEGDEARTADTENVGSKLPESISLADIRDKGSEKCGYEWLAGMELNENDLSDHVLEIEVADAAMDNLVVQETEQAQEMVHQTYPNQHELVKVLISRRQRRSRTFEEITRSREVVDVLEANGSARSIIDWAIKANLDREQKRAFEIITSTFILTFFKDAGIADTRGIHGVRHTFVGEKEKLRKLADVQARQSEQLICLLHGPGGCGKTTAIDLVMSYAMEYCSYLENYNFTSKTIIVTAMTGVAATILMGETTHSAVYLNQRKPIQAEQVELWADTRLVIIDEISFASKEDFEELHKKMRLLKQQLDQRYGGVNIIFSGDMRQLEPVGAGKKPIYTENCAEFKDWVNCFIELKGMHRFKDDPEWGELLLRFRNGEVTWDDIDKINERVVKRNFTILPNDIKYATFFNRDRDAINAALFEERLYDLHMTMGGTNDSVMIFSDDLKVQNSSKAYVPLANCAAFWETCGEDDVRMAKGGATGGRMDPVLRLYKGCRVMLPCNTNVKEGQANGTQAILERVVLKTGERPEQVLVDGTIPVAAVLASQVSHVVLRHSNKRIQPSCFTLQPKEHAFAARILKPKALQVKGNERELIKMKAVQVPLIVNNATTGHKLQGSSVDSVFVHDWSYRTNWVYVMLSRVRTREGLFCRKPLSKDLDKYAMPDGLQRMLQQFRTRSPTYWDEEDYDELFGE